MDANNYGTFINFCTVDNSNCGTLNCSQLCISTTGSLTCACHPGYYLNTLNLMECEGIKIIIEMHSNHNLLIIYLSYTFPCNNIIIFKY